MFQRKSNGARKNRLGASAEKSQNFERISRVLFEHRSAREGGKERERAQKATVIKIDEENGIM